MRIGFQLFILVILTIFFTACSMMGNQKIDTISEGKSGETAQAEQTLTPNTGAPVGGSMENAMDNIDKTKMFRALDNPPGKVTQWVNANTGITYTVTPIRKTTVNGNRFCRQYRITMHSINKDNEIEGTACVASDGNWEAV